MMKTQMNLKLRGLERKKPAPGTLLELERMEQLGAAVVMDVNLEYNKTKEEP